MSIDWNALLKQTGYPVANLTFEDGSAPKAPYVAWFIPSANRRGADNRVLLSEDTVMIELYRTAKDTKSEHVIEALLEGYEYQKNKAWVSEENLFLISYEIQILRRL